MNTRGLALQGALAAVGLVAAFLTWQREPEGMPGEITILDISKRALEKVRWEDATRYVELFRNPEEEDKLWVSIGEKPKPPAPPPAAPAGGVADGGVAGGADGGTTPGAADGGVASAPPPAAPPVYVPPPRILRANANAETLWGRLAQLKGTRAIGELDEKKREELGFVDSPRKLTFTMDGRQQVVVIGSPKGLPWSTPYVMRDDGKVFLMVTTILPDFENAMNRLVDRRLHKFEEGDFDALVVTQAKNSRTFSVSGKPPAPMIIAPQNTPGQQDEFVRNWHDRIWRIASLDVLGKGEEPPGSPLQDVFRVEYKKGGKDLGFFQAAKSTQNLYYVRTELSAGWIRVPPAFDTLATEAVKVASGS
jgi:hypothetical protein